MSKLYSIKLPDEKMLKSIRNQPVFNVGFIGSVASGKTSLKTILTTQKCIQTKQEEKRNITIKQGYGNMKVWIEEETKSNIPKFYTSDSKLSEYTTDTGNKCREIGQYSFVDCPGHHEYASTMLSSIGLMGGVIVVIAVNDTLDKNTQLIQHLIAAKLCKLDKMIICMNKIDLISKEVLMKRKEELDKLLLKYDIKPFIIIPTCINKNIGIDTLIKSIIFLFNSNNLKERSTKDNLFRINRSFDINKPGCNWNNVVGGVIGGTLITGTLNVDEHIEIRPGQVSKIKGNFVCQPIITKISSIQTDDQKLKTIIAGGLVGIRTDLDPFYTKNDGLKGNIAGSVGKLPGVYIETTIDFKPIDIFDFDWNPKLNDIIILQIGTSNVEGKLTKINKNKLTFTLVKPVCIQDNQLIIICKNINRILQIVGEGVMLPDDNLHKLLE